MRHLLFLLCNMLTLTLLGETITFDVYLWGNKIGRMIVSREADGEGVIHYHLRSHTKAKVLWIKREGISEYDAWYSKGKLVRSSLREIENGIQKRFSTVTHSPTGYRIDNYRKKTTMSQLPDDDIMGFYFSAKPTTTQVFYQPEAEILPVKQEDANSWSFQSSDGHTNIYRYKNGKIAELEFQLPLASVVMKRISE